MKHGLGYHLSRIGLGLLTPVVGLLSAAETPPKLPLSPPPTKQVIQQIQSDFLQLELPIKTRVRTTTFYGGENPVVPEAQPHYKRELEGDARVLQDSYHPALLCWALAPYLDDPSHDAEAYLILDAIFPALESSEWQWGKPTTYKSRSEPGDWDKVRDRELGTARSGAHEFGREFINQSLVTNWKELKSFNRYRVPPSEVLPSSLKKKPQKRNWFRRLFSK